MKTVISHLTYFMIIKILSIFLIFSNSTWATCGTFVEPRHELVASTLSQNEDNIWNDTDRFNLTFCVSDKFGKYKPQIIDAANSAAEKWMEHANVRFIYIGDEDANCVKTQKTIFSITRSVKRLPFSMKAFFPNAERKNRHIRVNEKYLHMTSYIRNTMLHEFGHVLGFRHEQIHPKSPSQCREEDQNYRPITDYDIDSIMHYKSCGGTGFGDRLSPLDQDGAAQMYP